MNIIKQIGHFLLLCILNVHTVFAQNTAKEVRSNLFQKFKVIDALDYSKSVELKKLISENKSVMEYFNKVCTEDTSTLHIDFKLLQDNLSTADATNGKMRKYLWNTNINGNEITFTQFHTRQGLKISWDYTENDLESFSETVTGHTNYDSIFSITTDNGKTVYLTIWENIIGQSTYTQNICAQEVVGDSLINISFFKTSKKILNSISVEYDPSYAPNIDIKSHIHIIKNKLYIPIIKGNILTKKYLIYVFNGDEFVFDKNAK